ncbi:MAG: MFS transporter [Candidatus Oxydemutatoraceae bacterium WSBS_2016_MAG_OTU14]
MFKNIRSPFVYCQLLFQVMFVGMTIGLFRTVVPALAEEKFNIPTDSLVLLSTFVVTFGLVKASLNLLAGKLSDRVGRRRILIFGWIAALPIPYLLAYAESWGWVIGASILLGINQGFCWSMSQTMKLDISPPHRYGVTVGLNETFGYSGVAITSYLSAWMTSTYGMQWTMLVFGFGTIIVPLFLAVLFCKETKPQKTKQKVQDISQQPASISYTTPQKVLYFSGMATKFTDTLIWLVFPVFLYQNGISLKSIGLISGVYTLVWGLSQIFMGFWSDYIGRKSLIIIGILLCAISSFTVLLSFNLTWWLAHSVVFGIGTAMFYPTLSASINDYATDYNRGGVLGMYRFWRDFGYFIGALTLGFVVMLTEKQESAFYCNGLILLVSVILLLYYLPKSSFKSSQQL